MRHLAKIISFLSDPIFLLCLSLFSVGTAGGPWQVALNGNLIILFGLFLPLFAGRYWAVRTKRMRDWNATDRKERFNIIIPMLIVGGIDIVLAKVFSTILLFKLFLFFYMWLVGFFILTRFWKISGHAGVSTLLALLWFFPLRSYGWLLFIIPGIVGWSRITMREHTLGEVIGGIVYSFLTVPLFFIIDLNIY